jgi:hypothetical protein
VKKPEPKKVAASGGRNQRPDADKNKSQTSRNSQR